MNVDVIIGKMVEVELIGDDGFRKVKETLTRIGLPSKQDKTLYQSAHILHRQGHYYICHFKECFNLDGRESTITSGDISRRNRIVQMLVDWNLVKPIDDAWKEPMGKPGIVKVIKYIDKDEWNLSAKYAIGVKKNKSFYHGDNE